MAAALAAANLSAMPPSPDGPQSDGDLAVLSLEELTHVEVTSAARKDQKLMKVAAAVYVITSDEIRRSGATSVPDVLRVVPGIEVAQISSNTWAVSARGFNGRSANKILVLVDGRSIYNSSYGGTLWDQNQVPMANIERIEVIRGPGATMWGANAVDGIISIITKKAKDTQGLTVSAEVGQNALPDSSVRYGGHNGDHLQYRLNAGYSENPGLLTASGSTAWDRWNSGLGGGRIDWQASDRDTVTFDGQIQKGGGTVPLNPGFPLPSPVVGVEPLDFSDGFVRSRWARQLDGSDFALESSYTREYRSEWIVHGVLSTIDIDFQHHIPIGSRHDLTWGGGYRFRDDNVAGLVQTPVYHENLFSLFAQDEISLVPSRLSLTAGVKIQDFLAVSRNNIEVQPQIRLLWTPGKASSVWAAVSRAVRMPSQVERDMDLSFALPAQNGIPASGIQTGDPFLAGEVVVAYETGYRRQLGKRFNVDIAGFWNRYSKLIGTVAGTPYLVFSPAPSIIVPDSYANTAGANTRGVEVAASWSLFRNWRLQTSYAWENASFESAPSAALVQPPGALWGTPANVLSLRSGWDVTRRWSVDSSLYSASAIGSQGVPAYARVDLRIARKFGEGGEFSAGVRNLLDEKHLEFRSEDYLVSSYIRRNAFARIVWHF